MTRRALPAVLLAIAALLFAATPARADHWHRWHHRGPRVVVGVAPMFGWGWGYYPGWWYYPPPYPRPYAIHREEPTVYIERPATSLEPGYWYYCESAGEYYPRVPSCPEPWVKVPPEHGQRR